MSLKPLSAAALKASLTHALAGWDGRQPLWVFGYGSLIWKPEIEFDRRVAARVHGYHRRLCLWSHVYRGTPDCPGLVAGLDRGGSCAGVALRVPARAVRAQFAQLWDREMFLGSYHARWVTCSTASGGVLRALAFIVRRDGRHYAGRLTEAEIIGVYLRGSCGRYGSSLDYLLNTVRGLRAHGLADPHLERLARHYTRVP